MNLMMKWNEIEKNFGDSGAKMIRAVLKNNSTLKELNLSSHEKEEKEMEEIIKYYWGKMQRYKWKNNR